MKGLVIINGYPAGEKFLRQGERIAAELTRLGAPTTVVKNGDVYALLERKGKASCPAIRGYDFAVYLDKDKYLGRAIEQAVPLFNCAKAVEICDDKCATYQALEGSGVERIRTIPAPLCYTQGASPSESFLRAVADTLGFPLVAKKSYGSFGKGVQLVHGYDELLALEREWLYEPHSYQEYIAASAGRDIRVIVIGGKAVAAMERVAKAGEFRSNIELGGEGNAVDLPEGYRRTAERAAQWLGLDYCGVDLLESGENGVVCEINSNAFFEGIEGVTGVNIPKRYAEHIVSVLAQRNCAKTSSKS